MYFFDMDDTLVSITDREMDAESLYLSLEYQQDIKPMMDLFEIIKVHYPTGLITSRHPKLELEIKNKFDINLVITRDFDLDTKRMMKIINSKKLTEIFLKKAVECKIKMLNEYANLFDIIFFDDMAARYWKNENLASNIMVCLPLHNQKELCK